MRGRAAGFLLDANRNVAAVGLRHTADPALERERGSSEPLDVIDVVDAFGRSREQHARDPVAVFELPHLGRVRRLTGEVPVADVLHALRDILGKHDLEPRPLEHPALGADLPVAVAQASVIDVPELHERPLVLALIDRGVVFEVRRDEQTTGARTARHEPGVDPVAPTAGRVRRRSHTQRDRHAFEPSEPGEQEPILPLGEVRHLVDADELILRTLVVGERLVVLEVPEVERGSVGERPAVLTLVVDGVRGVEPRRSALDQPLRLREHRVGPAHEHGLVVREVDELERRDQERLGLPASRSAAVEDLAERRHDRREEQLLRTGVRQVRDVAVRPRHQRLAVGGELAREIPRRELRR